MNVSDCIPLNTSSFIFCTQHK